MELVVNMPKFALGMPRRKTATFRRRGVYCVTPWRSTWWSSRGLAEFILSFQITPLETNHYQQRAHHAEGSWSQLMRQTIYAPWWKSDHGLGTELTARTVFGRLRGEYVTWPDVAMPTAIC